MEEWEYIERHKDLYKDVMTEDHQILNYVKLETENVHLNDIILNLTLEIIYRLTGENYEVVKSVSGEQITTTSCPNGSSHLVTSETYNKPQWRPISLLLESFPITVPPPKCLMTKRNVEKILEVANKMIELLTGEVPIRCQDVTVYFSMEEWKYLEGHKDLYKDVMTENRQMSTLLDVYKVHNTSEGLVNLSPDRSLEDLKQYSPNLSSRICPRSMNSSDPAKTSDLSEDHPSFHSASEDPSDSEESSSGTSPTVRHRDKKIFRCSECDKCYTSKEHVIRHQAVHTGLLPHTCSECGKSFGEKAVLIQHLRVHTEERPFSCPECGQGYKQRAHLTSHLTVHSSEKLFSCSECGKCFKRKDSLTVHQRNHTGKKQHTCTECGKSFTRRGILIKHQRTHTDDRPFCCTECGKLFKQKFCLDQHWKIHIHDFSCSVCKLMFKTRLELTKHYGKNCSKKVFPCSECEKFFGSKSHLVTHLRVHTGEKPFSCSECEKCFKEKGALSNHLRLHNGKTFSCSECGKKFTTKRYLVIHQRIHTGEPTYTCTECGKAFRCKSYLFQHQRLHTGETFACSDCEKVFIKKSLLAQHQRIHTGKKTL
ncbi:gastrula zinc finger protein XlCGF57.1-like [Rana temporaria]|uniref:gastrula zinc finger protein XlCGF57.1-like n=1 Tax=Rana temporaria TaxID=8407 RepID=UPI001AADF8C5|nr:gastrula zinc finger protein XlCGF57.1-like [Rana temporaria]